MEIAWDDRLDEDVLEEVGDLCFITVGLERGADGKVIYKKFISQYDAINKGIAHQLSKFAESLDRPEDIVFITPSIYSNIFKR